jgi:hypothetical protein
VGPGCPWRRGPAGKACRAKGGGAGKLCTILGQQEKQQVCPRSLLYSICINRLGVAGHNLVCLIWTRGSCVAGGGEPAWLIGNCSRTEAFVRWPAPPCGVAGSIITPWLCKPLKAGGVRSAHHVMCRLRPASSQRRPGGAHGTRHQEGRKAGAAAGARTRRHCLPPRAAPCRRSRAAAYNSTAPQ